MSKTIKIFLASSEELADERQAFETFIYRKCKEWNKHSIFIDLVIWEDFIDVMAQTRLQDEYNKAIAECQIFVMLFWNKVGKYTEEEFETAFRHFRENDKPFILTYFKDVESETAKEKSVAAFQNKLLELGHFATIFKNVDWLCLHFGTQLTKLYESSFDKFVPNDRSVDEVADRIYSPVNALLTKELMEGIEPFHDPVKRFLVNARRIPNWELQETICRTAQNIICCSYVGVIGIQLSRLFAIGSSDYTVAKQGAYITACNGTLKLSLQLLCFTFLSKLWDHKKENILAIPENRATAIRQFFEDPLEPNNEQYLNLLENLLQLFDEHGLDNPIPELSTIFSNEERRKEFLDACADLKNIVDLINQNELETFSALEAEQKLAKILRMLAFLSRYKMVSIKSISYDAMRYAPPRYIHNFISIGINSKQIQNQEGMDYVEAPVNTDVILLYTDQYQQSVNLFPFVIDVNALTFEGGSKICFYSHQDVFDESLNYNFPEGSSVFNIAYNSSIGNVQAMSELLIDAGKWKLLKLNKAYSLFGEARKTILA